MDAVERMEEEAEGTEAELVLLKRLLKVQFRCLQMWDEKENN